jgi:hypothetical protein
MLLQALYKYTCIRNSIIYFLIIAILLFLLMYYFIDFMGFLIIKESNFLALIVIFLLSFPIAIIIAIFSYIYLIKEIFKQIIKFFFIKKLIVFDKTLNKNQIKILTYEIEYLLKSNLLFEYDLLINYIYKLIFKKNIYEDNNENFKKKLKELKIKIEINQLSNKDKDNLNFILFNRSYKIK